MNLLYLCHFSGHELDPSLFNLLTTTRGPPAGGPLLVRIMASDMQQEGHRSAPKFDLYTRCALAFDQRHD
jgi:hypothetical protein